jgi:hypothetical protein
MNIQRHPSWDIIDSTKINSYMDCPRAYFYEYMLGWRSETPNIHLEFGKAWHLAMEHMLLHGYGNDSVMDAWSLLLGHYRKFWGPEYDDTHAPKNPVNALRALQDYAQYYAKEWASQQVLYTEVAGTVPISESRVIHFRMDSILTTQDGMFFSREHKTGSTVSRVWTDQWYQSIQTGTYNHVLYCLYPYEQVKGVEINGTFFQKKENKFQRVPCRRSREMMKEWFWTVLHHTDIMEWDKRRLLEECADTDEVMMAFPKNTGNCTKYFGCRYSDFCLAWPNPLRKVDEVPLGMKVEWWDPSEEESKVQFNF